jgi:Tfp pilus assembly protein PilF
LNFGTGVFFLESGDTSAAKPYLQKAYESDQMHYQVNLFLGIVALKEKDFDQAIKYF